MVKLFAKKTIECPRCLGKGHVDEQDIARLHMQLKWSPGPCAYCNEKGSINPTQLKKVAKDEAYLTVDISQAERKRLLAQDEGAAFRAKSHDENVNFFVKQVEFLHHKGLDAQTITAFFRIDVDEEAPSRAEMLEYIERIIALRQK